MLLMEGIREREKVLLILSEHAVSSSWVEKEGETAFEEEQRCCIFFSSQSVWILLSPRPGELGRRHPGEYYKSGTPLDGRTTTVLL